MSITEASVSRSFLDEVQWVNSTIASLHDYQHKNWAIGLNGDNSKPDGFLVSFAERNLPFTTYIQGAGLLRGNVSAGDPSAYDKNIATLNEYIQRIGAASVAA